MRRWFDFDPQRPGRRPDVRQLADATVTVLPIGRTAVLPTGARLVIRVDYDGTWSAAIAPDAVQTGDPGEL